MAAPLTHGSHTVWQYCLSEYWNVVVYLGAVALSNAFSNPDDVAALLFLQLDIGVEDAIVELVHE